MTAEHLDSTMKKNENPYDSKIITITVILVTKVMLIRDEWINKQHTQKNYY